MTTKTVGNYRFTRQLGAGAMGAVFEAVDVMVDRRVAIKMLHTEIARQPELIERFRIEAATLARLNHPCTATLYSFFREGEDYYMVMEFVPGETLDDIIQRSGRLPVETGISILQQVLQGLAHAHGLGILHRDIKPANIMISGDGHAKVTDFGIARVLGSAHLTRRGNVIGTLEYLPPERIRWEEGDVRSDLYSTGVVLFETLTGRTPFSGDTDQALLRAHLEQQPPTLRSMGLDCDEALEAVVRRAMEKRPEARFQSAQEFSDALAAVPVHQMKPTRLAAPPVPETRLAALPEPAANRKVMIWTAALLTAAIAVLSGIAVWVVRRPAPAPVPPAPVVEAARPAPSPPPAPAPEPALPPGLLDQPAAGITPVLTQTPAPAAPKPSQVRPAPVVEVRKKVELPPAEPAPAPVVAAPAPVVVVETPAPPPPPAIRSLRHVKTVYVEKMANDLDTYIKAEIADQMAELLAVVRRRDEADAILSGKAEETASTGSRMTGGYMGMKDQARGAVVLRDRSGRVDLWSGEAGDKTPILGALKRGGSRKVAERLVSSLRKAMKAAR